MTKFSKWYIIYSIKKINCSKKGIRFSKDYIRQVVNVTEQEYRKSMLSKTPEQLVDILVRQVIDNGKLKNEIKRLEEQHMQDVKKYKEQVTKTDKINEYWQKKERPLRRNDFNNDEVIQRYVAGESAYKIAKDTGVGQMTIISRLKRAGVYEGKNHNRGGRE